MAAEQLHIRDAVPKSRLVACVLSMLLGCWMLVVPIALIDGLKDVPGPWTATVTVALVACAVLTATLGGFRFFNALEERKRLSAALAASLAAAVAAALVSASVPGYGLLLLIPALVVGGPALFILIKDLR